MTMRNYRLTILLLLAILSLTLLGNSVGVMGQTAAVEDVTAQPTVIVVTATVTPEPVVQATSVPPPAEAVSPELQLQFAPLLNQVITICLTILSGLLVWLVKRGLDYIKVHLSVKQQAFLKMVIEGAVMAAEQLGASKMIQDTALAKKDYATKAIQKKLTEAGLFTLANDTKTIGDGIEAEVMEHFNITKKSIAGEWSTLGQSLAPLQPSPISIPAGPGGVNIQVGMDGAGYQPPPPPYPYPPPVVPPAATPESPYNTGAPGTTPVPPGISTTTTPISGT